MHEERVLHQDTHKGSEIDMRYLLGILIDSKTMLLSITMAGLLLATSYVLLAPDIYKADALIQMERSSSGDLFSGLYDLANEGSSPATTEITLIKSRAILGKTVTALGLDTLVAEKRLPFFGFLFLQPTSFIEIPTFTVPDALLEHSFSLKVMDKDHYRLEGEDIAIDGVFNKEIKQHGITLFVRNINALPDTDFFIKKVSRFSAMEYINNNLNVMESSKDSGVLRLSLLGKNKELIRSILAELSANYVQQNINRKSESASKSLVFLQQQLPKIESQLEKKEMALSHYQQANESIDLPLEARSVLDSEVAVVMQLDTLVFEEAELSQRYTASHPLYRALIEKKKVLLASKAALDRKIGNMPQTQQHILRLTRDVQAAQEMHALLISKQREFEINKASTVANVHIIDAAETLPRPVEPNRVLLLIGSLLCSFILAVIIVLVRSYFKRVISDSYQLQLMGMKVYSSIPYSKVQAERRSQRAKNNRGEKYPLLALLNPDDSAVEAIRSLRTSLYFLLKQAKNKILMVVGPTSNMGKSFVSCNLAVVFAQSGLRVLLVDCDMRKGYLHQFFLVARNRGLSELLSGQHSIKECLYKTEVPTLDFVPRGSAPSNPSELLLTSHFSEFCDWAANNYDVVLFDTPPILAVSDATIISHYSGANLMVTRFDVSTPKEVELSVQRFAQEGHEITGVVLNSVHRRAAQYFQYGHLEHYQYKTDALKF